MAAAKTKKTDAKSYRLDRFGVRHDITEQDVPEEPQPALPGKPTE